MRYTIPTVEKRMRLMCARFAILHDRDIFCFRALFLTPHSSHHPVNHKVNHHGRDKSSFCSSIDSFIIFLRPPFCQQKCSFSHCLFWDGS